MLLKRPLLVNVDLQGLALRIPSLVQQVLTPLRIRLSAQAQRGPQTYWTRTDDRDPVALLVKLLLS